MYGTIPSLSAAEGICEGGHSGWPGSGIRQLGGFYTAPFPSCVALGKLLNFLKSAFPIYKSENNSILVIGLL